MLSSVDLESLIALKKRELITEKTVLGLAAPDRSPEETSNLKQNYKKNVQFIEEQQNGKSNSAEINAQLYQKVNTSTENDTAAETCGVIDDLGHSEFNHTTIINNVHSKINSNNNKTHKTNGRVNNLQEIKLQANGVTRNVVKQVTCTENVGYKSKINKNEDVEIPRDLERYIRRYLGLPVMLKAGEYSPNNPMLREDRPQVGDAFLGLGEYERRVGTLRKLRQNDYKEYLLQQARKKQEEKLRLEQEKREQEQRERAREQYLLRLERERDEHMSERNSRIVAIGNNKNSYNKDISKRPELTRTNGHSTNSNRCGRDRVDTGTQVEAGFHTIAVQTDESAFFGNVVPQQKSPLTRAERELSPRLGVEPVTNGRDSRTTDSYYSNLGRRRSHDDYYDPTSINPTAGTEPRNTYMPSIFDADAIDIRNVKAQQEAAAKRTSYQQELKAQIEEQQRIREERKARERMLEQAEMRRLEDQLRMLRMAQEQEVDKNQQIIVNMRENARDYERKRTTIQREIDREKQSLLQTRKSNHTIKRLLPSKSLENNSYTTRNKIQNRKKLPFSSNIPDSSVFSPNYDVDSYLRKNLNPTTQSLICDGLKNAYKIPNIISRSCIDLPNKFNGECSRTFENDYECIDGRNIVVDKALVHTERSSRNDGPRYEPSFLRKNLNELIVDTPDESLPIPTLRHSPAIPNIIVEHDAKPSGNDENPSRNDGKWSQNDGNPSRNDGNSQNDVLVDDDLNLLDGADDNEVSEAMRRLEEKWKVPLVKKNILKTIPSSQDKGTNILTQLGSIRRQLQMEQLKLDRMSKSPK